jgi:hypothetical protein
LISERPISLFPIKKKGRRNLPSLSDVIEGASEVIRIDGRVDEPYWLFAEGDTGIVDESENRTADRRRRGSTVDETKSTVDGYNVVGAVCGNILKGKGNRELG